METKVYSGEEFSPLIPQLAQLRIGVFREYPYLYDGDVDYEANYLRHYQESPQSVLVIVKDEQDIVGASTGLPLAEADPAFLEAFQRFGLDPAHVFYFGESVLGAAYRKQGVGAKFFDLREAHARRHGFRTCAFCAVVRDANDPRRPVGYTPLHAFWQRKGFTHHPELTATFRWKEIGESQESDHVMSFWIKQLEPA